MMQVLGQPWEAVKYLGNQEGHDVTRRNAGHAGHGGHVTQLWSHGREGVPH